MSKRATKNSARLLVQRDEASRQLHLLSSTDASILLRSLRLLLGLIPRERAATASLACPFLCLYGIDLQGLVLCIRLARGQCSGSLLEAPPLPSQKIHLSPSLSCQRPLSPLRRCFLAPLRSRAPPMMFKFELLAQLFFKLELLVQLAVRLEVTAAQLVVQLFF